MLHIVINNVPTAWHGLLNVCKVDPKGHAVVVEGGCVDISLTVRAFVHGILADLLPGAGAGSARPTCPPRQAWFIVLVLSPAVKTPSTKGRKRDVARV